MAKVHPPRARAAPPSFSGSSLAGLNHNSRLPSGVLNYWRKVYDICRSRCLRWLLSRLDEIRFEISMQANPRPRSWIGSPERRGRRAFPGRASRQNSDYEL